MFSSAKAAGTACSASALGYLRAAALTALAGAVYEHFSFGVWSFFMVYAFAFPLLLGALPMARLARRGRDGIPAPTRGLLAAGIATLTVGSLMTGALEIYGTENPLTLLYWPVGGALVLGAAAAALMGRRGQAA